MPRRLPLVTPAADPPPFARLGIVGLGLMGGSIALAARRRWPSALVVGVDRNDVLEEAQRAHAVDVGADDLGMLVEVNLVVLAAPVLENLRLLAELPAVVKDTAVITDVGSTKHVMVAAARSLPPRLTFVGGHPLAGAARSGLAHASPDVFRRRPWILTPEDPTAGAEAASAPLALLERFVRALGAEPKVMSAEEHDRLVAWISHLPQLAASVLMQVIGDAVGEDGLALAGRGLRDTTRLATSPGRVWTDICGTNRDAIAVALDEMLERLRVLRGSLDDPPQIARLFERAAHWRGRLPEAFPEGPEGGTHDI